MWHFLGVELEEVSALAKGRCSSGTAAVPERASPAVGTPVAAPVAAALDHRVGRRIAAAARVGADMMVPLRQID